MRIHGELLVLGQQRRFPSHGDALDALNPAFHRNRLERACGGGHSLVTKGIAIMFTPILMLVILTAPHLANHALAALQKQPAAHAPAAWGLGLLFLFTASGHFFQTQQMVEMLPSWVPAREALVYATGLLEIVIGAGFFSTRTRAAAGWAAAAVLVGFFPANVYAAIQHVPMGGHAWGPAYLLIRTPLQLFILGWVYYFVLRAPSRMR